MGEGTNGSSVDGTGGEPPPAAVRTAETDPRRWWALGLLGLAMFMVVLDSTIVLTAIPTIQEELGFSVSGVQWVVTAYALTFAGLMLFFGRMGDLLGRRRIFVVGVALFMLSSLACALAWSGEVLVVGRAIQGVSAAVMAPTALSIVVSTFTDPTERNRALGIWGGLGGVGATAGLLLGGVITYGLGWEWIFFINLPIGAGVLVLTPFLVRESTARGMTRSFDLGGAVTITGAVFLFIYGVTQAGEIGWASLRTLSLLTGAAVLLAVFVAIERRTASPLIPLQVFRSRIFLGGNLLILLAGMSVDGLLFPLTLYAQGVLGYSPLEFGLMSAVMTVMSVVGAMTGQALVTKWGLRPVGVAGMVLLAAGALMLTTVSADGSFVEDLLIGLLVFGPGLGAAFVASQIAGFVGVGEEEYGLAAGLIDTSFNFGNALGVAIVTSVAMSVSAAVVASDPSVSSDVALNEGLQSSFLVTALFAGLGLLVALFVLRRPRSSDDDLSARADATEAQAETSGVSGSTSPVV